MYMSTFTTCWFAEFANSAIIITLVNSKFHILELVKVMQRRLQCCIMFQFLLIVTLNRMHMQIAKIQMSLSAPHLDQSWLTIQTRSATSNVRSESRGNAVLWILIRVTWTMYTNLWIFIKQIFLSVRVPVLLVKYWLDTEYWIKSSWQTIHILGKTYNLTLFFYIFL